MQPLRRVSAFAARLMRSRLGTMAVATAVITPTLLVLLSASVNFVRAEHSKQKLQAAIDSAALTLARTASADLEPRAVVQSYINANLRTGPLSPDNVTFTVAVEAGQNGRSVDIATTATVDLFYADAFDIDNITFKLYSSSKYAVQNIEVAMVLDISQSMKGSKITNMKAATRDFLDIVLKDEQAVEFTRVNIIPYAGSTQLGDGFEDYLHVSEDPMNWSGCLDTRAEIMNDGGLEEGAYIDVPAEDWRWGNGSKYFWCPPSSSQVQFHWNDLEALKLYTDAMQMGDGTGTDIAIAWGLKSLSPTWRGKLPGGDPELPSDYSQETLKVLLVMTDGDITGQSRVAEWTPEKKNTWVYKGGNAQKNFTNVCEEAKGKTNLVVYTVGFELKKEKMTNLLRDCATSHNHFFEAEGTEISEVFSFIARELSALRLTN
ncbi:MAG: pilus assembly protein [Pseudomonadota bacterium]